MWTYEVTPVKGLTIFKDGVVFSTVTPKYDDDKKELNAISSARYLYDLAHLLLSDDSTTTQNAQMIIEMVHNASRDLAQP